MWDPHVSDWGEKRWHRPKAQTHEGNVLQRRHQGHAGLPGRLGEVVAWKGEWAGMADSASWARLQGRIQNGN
jgi:hypothetical protein